MMTLPGIHKWTLKANWKFAAEQFGGDNYHTMWAHESGVRTSIAQQFGGEHPWTNDWEAKTKEGHGWINFAFADPPGIAEVVGPYTAWLREQASNRLTPTQNRANRMRARGNRVPEFLDPFVPGIFVRAGLESTRADAARCVVVGNGRT